MRRTEEEDEGERRARLNSEQIERERERRKEEGGLRRKTSECSLVCTVFIS